MSGKKLTKRT